MFSASSRLNIQGSSRAAGDKDFFFAQGVLAGKFADLPGCFDRSVRQFQNYEGA